MNFYNRQRAKTILGCIILAAGFLSACQPEMESANFPAQQNAANSQPAAIRVSAPETNASEPAIAADENGDVYVIYVEHNADKSADVYLQKYDAGKLSGETTRVNPEKGQAKTWFGDAPTIKVGTDGAIYIGWMARVNSAEKPGANNLYLSVSRDGGKSFDAPVKVNDDAAPATHGMHSLAIGADNRVYMAWLDERNLKDELHAAHFNGKNFSATESEFEFIKAHHNSNQSKTIKSEKPVVKDEAAEPNSETFFAVSVDGGKTFTPNVKLSSDVCPCCKTNLLVAPDGKIYVSWRQVLPDNFRHIAVASSIDGGSKFSAPVIVSDDRWQISACPVSGAPLRLSAANRLKTAWFTAGSAGKQGIYLAESDDGGKTFAPRRLVSENAASGTPILLDGKQKTDRIVWAESGKILTSRLDNDSLTSAKRQEIAPGEFPAAAFSGGRTYVVYVRKDKEKPSVWLSVVE